MTEEKTPAMTGGCQCGAVRYALYRKPKATIVCHCRMCQKAVGGPFAVFASVKEADFAWTHGSPGTFESSTIAARDFCPRCGTPLTFRYLDSGQISVSSGSLDDPGAAVPNEQFGMESRLSWLDALQDMPGSTTEADMPAAMRQRLVNRQHPDRDPAADDA